MADDRLPLFGEYVLDQARGCLVRGRDVVHLRPQAYQLLKYLANNRGHLIEKDQLVEQIWQGRAVGDDSLVQCLRDVRQALGDRSGQYIRTVRGRGYIFDTDEPESEGGPVVFAEQVDFVRVVVDEQADTDEPGPGTSPFAAIGTQALVTGRRVSTVARILVIATGMVALMATAYTLLRDPARPPTPIGSVAVLPFGHDAADPDVEYLADGSTESLINSLSQLPAVSVKARSLVFRYQAREVTPQEAAAELGVESIIEGRVARRGDSLTVSLSLVDGRTGNQLWGNQYTQKLSALPSMQRQMAGDLADRLQGRDSSGSSRDLTIGYAPSGDAYLLYLRGRYHHFKTTEADIRAAIGFYQQAVHADPRYAVAYTGLAEAYRALSIVGQVPSKEAFPQARAAALRALELDNDLAEPHIALGWIAFSYDWDWSTAEHQLQTAISLSPRSADAHRAYAHMLSNQGRHDEALVEAARARELDPRGLLVNALEGQFLFYAGRLDEADERFRKTMEIEPEYWVAHQGVGRVFILRGMFREAIVALRKARELSSQAIEPTTQLGYALARSGNRVEARSLYRELERRSTERYVPAYSLAMILNGLAETDAALRQLEQSVDQREVQATFIKIDTRWDTLRPDPRFVALLKRVGFE